MELIDATRTAKSHNLNDRSSRSHCIITLKLQKISGKSVTNSKFIFADLAGSERIAKSGVVDTVDLRMEEARNINGSLTALGKVIDQLAKKQTHVAYRDSSLTMLLKDSLTGNVRTGLVVTVSGRSDMMSETSSSLKFAITCGNLKTSVQKATVNVEKATGAYFQQLEVLTQQLREMEDKGMAGGLNPTFANHLIEQFFHNVDYLQKEEEKLSQINQ